MIKDLCLQSNYYSPIYSIANHNIMFSSSFNHSIILFPFYKILKLRGQAEEQEASLKAQEEEVNTKKRELEVLIEEEQKLNSDIKKSQRDIEMLVKSLSDVEKLLEEVFTRSS